MVLYPYIHEFSFKAKVEGNPLKIAFSGQSYAEYEIGVFLNFLNSQEWRLGNRNVELHVFGSNSLASSKNITCHGWVDVEELSEHLSECDLSLLPYPLETEMSEVSRNSFPNKLITYVSAGLPIIYIGPDDSSVMSFVKEIGVHLKVGMESSWNLEIQDLLKDVSNEKLERFHEQYFSKSQFAKTIELWMSSNQIKREEFNDMYFLKIQDKLGKTIRQLEAVDTIIFKSQNYGRKLLRFERILSFKLPLRLVRISEFIDISVTLGRILASLSKSPNRFKSLLHFSVLVISKIRKVLRSKI
jgi:hypothetical protein